ncbi:MAG: ricin-type beta-trefoil lectin domain protein [Saprospiraceae bacterium]|nr:ricin-type beta-trefoil lectin domain protein [Saprospiraceae bacterium]
MNTQMNQSNAIIRQLPAVIFLICGFLFGLRPNATAADSLLYIGKLPVPGTTTVSDYLSLSQNGTILENDQVALRWQSDGNLVLYYCNTRVLWSSNTQKKGTILSFQKSEGKLVIKNASGNVIWSSPGTTANTLKIRWNHILALLDSSGKALWSANTGYAMLTSDDTGHTISFSKSVQEYMIPPDCAYRYLYLRAEGGDGGKRRVEEITGAVRFEVAGGSGATIIGIFEIGTGPNMIPPGSSVRFMLGSGGGTSITQRATACAGGGGTGVAFRKPNEAYWHLLLVAGGGGGAYSDCCSVKREGRSAVTEENGGYGGGDKWAGGKNGADGTFDFSFGLGSPGFGINYVGWSDKQTANGPKDYVVTGLPGTVNDNGNIHDWTGMGPGGASGDAGAGGGGFSGGGAGATSYPGGGGGSFVNTDFAVTEFRRKNSPTKSTQAGFVEYQFGNDFFKPIRMEKYPGSCLTDENGQTDNGNQILLSVCNGGAAQNWFLQGLTIHYGGQLDKCLDLPNSDTYVGNGIQLNDCNGYKAQVWIYDGVTKYIRSGLDMNKCFHAADGSNPSMSNNRIALWDCKDVANMRWAIDGATNPTISTNQNRILYAGNTKKCLDVYQGNMANGTNIQLYDCNNGAAQNWYFDANVIRFNKDRNKCLDLTQSKTDNGANIQLFDCNDTNAQKWTYNGITKSFHSWVDPTKCIDVDHGNTANSTNIQLFDCNGTGAQQFLIGN